MGDEEQNVEEKVEKLLLSVHALEGRVTSLSAQVASLSKRLGDRLHHVEAHLRPVELIIEPSMKKLERFENELKEVRTRTGWLITMNFVVADVASVAEVIAITAGTSAENIRRAALWGLDQSNYWWAEQDTDPKRTVGEWGLLLYHAWSSIGQPHTLPSIMKLMLMGQPRPVQSEVEEDGDD